MIKSATTVEKNWVPEWAREVIWYQIFPERFCNGDPSNNPTLKDICGAWPNDCKSEWAISPWGADWYAMQRWEKKNGRDIWFQIQRRRFGGDLQGVINRLDYLEELGINAIYLNPIFDSPSSHKYDGATYHHVDPNLGPDPVGDREKIATETPHDPQTWVWTAADKLVLELIAEVHRRDMRIIFDGVFNHMGVNSWAFRDVKKNQQQSPYHDWFAVNSWDDPHNGSRFDYEGWFGHKNLPELREDENGIVEAPRQYIFDATRRWMTPCVDGKKLDGIDGWRLDVAFWVKHPFWKAWRKLVKSLNPEAYLTAEVIEPMDVLKPYLEGDEFDAVMNYNFSFSCTEFFIDKQFGINVSQFDEALRELRQAFDPCVAYVQQNLYSSHDTNRFTSHILNGDLASSREFGAHFAVSKGNNPKYNVGKPDAEAIRLQMLMAIMQMTYLGAPMIYYGDEVGLWGANDPCCRKPMLWADIAHEDEVKLPDGTDRELPNKVEVNQEIFKHYQKLIHIRKTHEALRLGDFRTEIIDDKRGIYGFSRNLDHQRILVILNNGPDLAEVELPEAWQGELRDLLNDNKFQTQKISIERKWARILLPQCD